MKTYIPAGMASSAPPLGTMLGQVKSFYSIRLWMIQIENPFAFKRNLNIANFVKDFNEKTKNIKEGTPLPTWVHMQVILKSSNNVF